MWGNLQKTRNADERMQFCEIMIDSMNQSISWENCIWFSDGSWVHIGK